MRLHTYSLDAALTTLPGFPELRGRRTRLRAPRTDDAAVLFALHSDPAVVRYRQRPPMATPQEAVALLDECIDGFATRTRVDWMLMLGRDDAAIGTCALSTFDSERRTAEIGYALLPCFWGRGLAHDAVTRAIDWGISELGLARIDASVSPANMASRRLLRKLGFRECDAHDQAEWLCLLSGDWSGT